MTGTVAASRVPAIAERRPDNGTMPSTTEALASTEKTREVKLDLPVGIPSTIGFLSWARNGSYGYGEDALVAEALRRAGLGGDQ